MLEKRVDLFLKYSNVVRFQYFKFEFSISDVVIDYLKLVLKLRKHDRVLEKLKM